MATPEKVELRAGEEIVIGGHRVTAIRFRVHQQGRHGTPTQLVELQIEPDSPNKKDLTNDAV